MFAIVQAANVESGLRMVNITGVPDVAACESYLAGAAEGDPGRRYFKYIARDLWKNLEHAIQTRER